MSRAAGKRARPAADADSQFSDDDLYDSGDLWSDDEEDTDDYLFFGDGVGDISAANWDASAGEHEPSISSSAGRAHEGTGSGTGSGTSGSGSAGLQAAPRVAAQDRLLQDFATSWLQFKMTESELAEAFRVAPWRVKQLREECRAKGLAAPAAQTGRVEPSLPTREELADIWQAADLSSLPVADALEKFAADPRIGVTVTQLQRHFRGVGFSPRHPVPEDEVFECLRKLTARAWCNRLGPNFARCETDAAPRMAAQSAPHWSC